MLCPEQLNLIGFSGQLVIVALLAVAALFVLRELYFAFFDRGFANWWLEFRVRRSVRRSAR